MVREQYRNSVKNCHAYPGADADTDHNLVMMTAFLTLKKVKKRKQKKRWDREKLKHCQEEFAEAVDKKIQHGATEPTDTRWQNFKKTVVTQAKKTVGYKKEQQTNHG